MKNRIIILIAAAFIFIGYNNAYSQCTPATSSNIDGGFFPPDSTQQCAERNQPYSLVVQLQNFGQVATGVYVESTRIDTVYNLPSGLNWQMSVPVGNAVNTLLTGEIGCILFSGTTSDNTGTYVLDLWVTVQVNLQGNSQTFSNKASALVPVLNQTFGTDYDLSYRVFVVNNQTECISYVGIDELDAVKNLSVYPNPFSNKTVISFNTGISGKYTARLFNIVGQEVLSKTLNVYAGENSFEIVNNSNLVAGVYHFVISDGNKAVSRKVVIE
jgi:hypothetical protein